MPVQQQCSRTAPPPLSSSTPPESVGEIRPLLATGDLASVRRLLAEGATPELGPLTDPAAIDLIYGAAGTLEVDGVEDLVRSSVGLGRVAVVRALLRHGLEVPDDVAASAERRGHVEITRLLAQGVETEVDSDAIASAAQNLVVVIDDSTAASVCLQDLLVLWRIDSTGAAPVAWERLQVNTVTGLSLNRVSGVIGVGCEDEGLLTFDFHMALGRIHRRAEGERIIGDRTGVRHVVPLGDTFFEVPAKRPLGGVLAAGSTAGGGVVLVDGPEMRRDDLALRVRRLDGSLEERWAWTDSQHASLVSTALAAAQDVVGLVHRTDRGSRLVTLIGDDDGRKHAEVELSWEREMVWRETIDGHADGFVVVNGAREVGMVTGSGVEPLHRCDGRVLCVSTHRRVVAAGTDAGLVIVER